MHARTLRISGAFSWEPPPEPEIGHLSEVRFAVLETGATISFIKKSS